MNKAKFLKTITLTNFNEISSKCQEFSSKMYDKDMAERHQWCGSSKTREQLIDSNFKSKLAEFAVVQYFQQLGIECSLPDLKIYGRFEKNHDADLRIIKKDGNLLEIAVKSQHVESIRKFGASALIMKNSYETQKNRHVIFVETSDDLITCNIYFCGTMKDLERSLPKSPIAQDKKYAFYFNLGE